MVGKRLIKKLEYNSDLGRQNRVKKWQVYRYTYELITRKQQLKDEREENRCSKLIDFIPYLLCLKKFRYGRRYSKSRHCLKTKVGQQLVDRARLQTTRAVYPSSSSRYLHSQICLRNIFSFFHTFPYCSLY
jgi:hypothetical protein